MLNRKDFFKVALIFSIIYIAFSFMGSEKGADKSFLHYERIVLAPGDNDTLAFYWTPKRTSRNLGRSEGFNTLVIIADSSVTDFGDQDSLTIIAKDRFYLKQVRGPNGVSLADSTSDLSMNNYQSASNDSVIVATRQAYTLRQPVIFTLRMNVADGVVLFLNNEATLGDSTRFHVYVYNK